MRIGVTISRDWFDFSAIERALRDAIDSGWTDRPPQVTLVHGASQMDFAVAGIAYMLGMDLEAHPADWKSYGKSAGMVRNSEMVNSGADVWLAFIKDASPGASHCARLAEAEGIPTRRYRQ